MTPEQALKMLTDATASIPAPRREHQLLLEAIEVIRYAITPQPVKAEPATAGDSALPV